MLINVTQQSSALSKTLEWEKWRDEIPYIDFPKEYLVRAIPPFHGSIIRYNIKHKKYDKLWVSIYLDCYDILGCYGSPYWEIYPYKGDIFRCGIDNIEELLKAIKQSFKDQRKEIKNDPINQTTR